MKTPKFGTRVDCLVVPLAERAQMKAMQDTAPVLFEALLAALAAMQLNHRNLHDADSRMISLRGQNECLLAIALAKGALK